MPFDFRIEGFNPYNNITSNPLKEVKKTTSPFEQIFNAAMDVVKETNQYQLAADSAQIDFATGKTDDVLAVLLAQEKAYSSLNFTVQITNKIVESYREIMRMQI